MPDRIMTASHRLTNIEQLDAAGLAFAMAVRMHEYTVTAGYESALAREPGLRLADWERQNSFVPPALPMPGSDRAARAEPTT